MNATNAATTPAAKSPEVPPVVMAAAADPPTPPPTGSPAAAPPPPAHQTAAAAPQQNADQSPSPATPLDTPKEQKSSPFGVMNFLIPSSAVSGVIGKGGATVREIVRSTRCRVSVACQTNGRPVVVLIGGAQERLAALAEIRSLLDDKQLNMLVPERQLGLVIGKAGSHIAEVAARTKTQLSLSRDSYPENDIPSHVPRDGHQKELTITGEFDATQYAVELVLAKLDEHFPTEILGGGGSGSPLPPSSGSTGRPDYRLGSSPHQLQRSVYGQDSPRTQHLTQQQQQSSQQALVPGSSATPLLDVLSARQRSPSQQQQQQQQQQLQHHQQQFSPSGGGGVGSPGAARGPPLRPLLPTSRSPPRFQSPQQSQVGNFMQPHANTPRLEARPNLMVSIPKREVGGYIGKDGTHVRELERLSGARISVESSKGEADKASTVTFRGTVDENVRAYQLTVQLLAELHHASASASAGHPLNDPNAILQQQHPQQQQQRHAVPAPPSPRLGGDTGQPPAAA